MYVYMYIHMYYINAHTNLFFLLYICLCIALYQELGEKGNEMENAEYQSKKADDLQKRLADAHSSIHHIELVRHSCCSLMIS